MSAIIATQMAYSGVSVYAIVRDMKTGYVANGATTEVYNSANYATYKITATEQSPTGFFSAPFPSYLPAGLYSVSWHQGGGSAGDPAVDRGILDWSGAVENYLGIVTAKLPTGLISGFDPTSQNVNLNSNQSGVTIGMVNALGASAAASVKTQIDASVGSDAISELTGVPSSTPTLKAAIMFLFMALRNKRTSNATTIGVYNASGSQITSAPQSDNGTTYTKDNFS